MTNQSACPKRPAIIGLALACIALVGGCAAPQGASHSEQVTVSGEQPPSQGAEAMMSITPFLMFQSRRAEEAMERYVALFPNSSVVSVKRYEEGQAGPAGSLELGEFEIAGQRIMCIDSPITHAFGFTPSVSLFVTLHSRDEFDRVSSDLSAGGEFLMPPDNYGFSERFAWLNDEFGVSWQINLAKE